VQHPTQTKEPLSSAPAFRARTPRGAVLREIELAAEDLSKVELTHHKLKDEGKRALVLGDLSGNLCR